MSTMAMTDRTSLRMSAVLLLAGQVLYILVTQWSARTASPQGTPSCQDISR